MSPLLSAIYDKWHEATELTSSGPWLDMADDKASYPYGVITITGGSHDPFYDSTYDEVVNIRFTVFDDNLADVGTIQDNLHTRLDKTKLTLSSGRNYHSLRTGQMRRFAGVAKDGSKIYQAISDYQFKVRKSY